MKKILNKLFVFIFLVVLNQSAQAFGSVNGPTIVAIGSSNTYSVYFSSGFVPNYIEWTVYGGTVTSYGYGKFSATIQFP